MTHSEFQGESGLGAYGAQFLEKLPIFLGQFFKKTVHRRHLIPASLEFRMRTVIFDALFFALRAKSVHRSILFGFWAIFQNGSLWAPKCGSKGVFGKAQFPKILKIFGKAKNPDSPEFWSFFWASFYTFVRKTVHCRLQKPKTHLFQDVNFWVLAFEGESGFLGILGIPGSKIGPNFGPKLAKFWPKTQTHPHFGVFWKAKKSNLC